MLYSMLLLIHILLLVFWLGTDLGVFLAAKYSERSDLSAETRATVLEVGMILDRLPRSALVLILPSGALLLDVGGMAAVPLGLHLGFGTFALIWLAVLWTGFLTRDEALQDKCMLVNLGLNALMALGVTGVAIWLLNFSALALWVSLKILLVGLAFVAGVLLDVLFRPAVLAFGEIMVDGATLERDARYARAIAPVYMVVLAIYGLVLIAAGLGVLKPIM